jgi:hypothetical protein
MMLIFSKQFMETQTETRRKVTKFLQACNEVAMSNNYKGPANFIKLSTSHAESIAHWTTDGVFGGTMKVIQDDSMNDEALIGRDDDSYSVTVKLT